MNRNSVLLILALQMFAGKTLLAQGIQASPTRPSASDNAYLTAPGWLELEAGLALTDNGWTLPTLLKFATLERLEFGFLMNGLLDRFDAPRGTETEVGDPGGQAKYQFLNDTWGAVAGVARVDFLGGGDTRLTAYSVLSYQHTAFQMDLTLGGSDVDLGSNRAETFFYAIAFSPKLQGKTGGYLELFGEQSDGASAFSLDVGLTRPISPRLVADIAFAFGLTDDAADWVLQVGFTGTLVNLKSGG